MTPAEIALVLEAHVKGIERRAKMRRADIHALASLIGVAVNNPKKLPSGRDFIKGRARSRFSSDAEIDSYFRTLRSLREAQGAGHV
ncbi:hypothetical protein Q4560_05145 [Celeribacter halophilus]|uniref:hypothetical protein n=1 Tax=Celeribacter halophilus TaxID=576117 RepID=UPI0026E3CDAA|nr:hypothetical protein [Celeribacter halophilus]MDO6722643.1 hypothetical protein [Celeribacter halophilus]